MASTPEPPREVSITSGSAVPPLPGTPRVRLRFALGGVAILALAGAIFATGCGGEDRRSTGKRNDDLQTVEVAPPPDARIDVGTDKQERRRSEVFSGVLPGGFPRSFPLPPHSTLVDQGAGAGGPWVELLVPQKIAAVRDAFLQRLRAGGWEPTAAGDDAWRCERGGSRVRVSLRAQGPSTRVRLEY